MDVTGVPESVSGVADGVGGMTSCVATHFVLDAEGKPAGMKQFPKQYPCKLMATVTRGTVSISAHGLGVMMTLRLDDIQKLIEEAYANRS